MLRGGYAGGLELRRNPMNDETHLRGAFPYAAPTVLVAGNGPGQARREVFAPRAFAARVADTAQDIHLLVGHSYDKPIASRAAGTLNVIDSDEALIFEATINPEMRAVSYVADLLSQIAVGLTRGLSPGFRVASTPGAESIEPDADGLLRTVRSADLFELSIVTRAAYEAAQVEARNWQPAQFAALRNPLHRWRL